MFVATRGPGQYSLAQTRVARTEPKTKATRTRMAFVDGPDRRLRGPAHARQARRSLTASRSDKSSLVDASMRVCVAASTVRPCTISYFQGAVMRHGNE